MKVSVDFESVLRSPWFYSSPGPISISYYAILIVTGAWLLLKRGVTYKRWPWMLALTDSFFLTGFIVLTGDVIWMSLCALRFLPAYWDSLPQVFFVLLRDFVGLIFCFLIVASLFKQKIIHFNKWTLTAYIALFFFLAIGFNIAADPTFTDWTYAIRQGCSTEHVLKVFFSTYVAGKVLSTFLWWAWWKR